MAEIVPFIGTRYDRKVVGDIGAVVCPPYDVITPELQDELYRRHRHNFVRLVMGKDLPTDDEYNNRYERAARYFREWKSEGILVDDDELSFYLCEQVFRTPSGEKRRRRGFFAAAKIEDGPNSKIRAHEQTFPGPKADRLRLLRASQCNLSPVFMLCPDPDKRVVSFLSEKMRKRPIEQFTDYDGVETRLWICQSLSDVQRLQEAVRGQSLLIADGHHRYETAVAYRAEMSEALGHRHKNMPFDYLMVFVTSLNDDGLIILPTHRALRNELGDGVDLDEILGDICTYFKVEKADVDFDQPDEAGAQLVESISRRRDNEVRLAMLLPNRSAYVLTLKNDVKLEDVMTVGDLHPAIRNLDVSILHHFIINQIWIGNPEIEPDEGDVIYTRNAGEIVEHVRRRQACVGFLINAPRLEQVREIAELGLRMPPKSTHFYPKIPSGIVVRSISRQ